MPQWELKVLEWWQGSVPKGCHTIFDQRAGNMKASISDPLQVELKIDNAPATYEGTHSIITTSNSTFLTLTDGHPKPNKSFTSTLPTIHLSTYLSISTCRTYQDCQFFRCVFVHHVMMAYPYFSIKYGTIGQVYEEGIVSHISKSLFEIQLQLISGNTDTIIIVLNLILSPPNLLQHITFSHG